MADEALLRATAQHRGLKLVKSRRRKPGTGDFGRYGLADAKTGQECFGFGENGLTATAEDIEHYLRSGEHSSWKRSLKETGGRPKPLKPPRPRADNDPVEVAAEVRQPELDPPQPEPELEPPPRPQLKIRKFRNGDLEELASLLSGETSKLQAYVKARQPLLVAERDGLVGCAAWQVVRSPQGIAGRITTLFVAAPERRQGVGSKLLAALEAEFRSAGCDRIEAISEIDVANAHGFFRRSGFDQAGYQFTKSAAGNGRGSR